MASHPYNITAKKSQVFMSAPQFAEHMSRLLKLERDEEVLEIASSTTDNGPASAVSTSIRQMEYAGNAISRISLVNVQTGFGGKPIWELKPNGNRIIDWSGTQFRTGDIITIREQGSSDGDSNKTLVVFHEGVLMKCEPTLITVMLNSEEDSALSSASIGESDSSSSKTTYAVMRIGSEATYKKSKAAMDELASSRSDHVSLKIRDLLFTVNDGSSGFSRSIRYGNLSALSEQDKKQLDQIWTEQRLNDTQIQAVMHALDSLDLAVIHGPPGTGKTTCLVALILALVHVFRLHVLVVAPSNLAVDNIVERLGDYCFANKKATRSKSASPDSAGISWAKGMKMVRVGHPARLLPNAEPFSLQTALAKSDDQALARDIRSELDSIQCQIDGNSKSSSGRLTREQKSALFSERKVLRKELAQRERLALCRTIRQTNVVLSTAVGSGARAIQLSSKENSVERKPFDVVVIDEAGQGLEASLWIAILQASKVILAGDPYQLPPTVKSKQAEAQGLAVTLLDRIFGMEHCSSAVYMLTEQFRMNRLIAQWSSDTFYKSELKPHPSVENHLLAHLVGKSDRLGNEENDLFQPLVFIDTSGCECEESVPSDTQDSSSEKKKGAFSLGNESRLNKGEAALVARYVSSLINAGVLARDIGVITPYAAQVKAIKGELANLPKADGMVEVSTVDGFQGREKEAIVISMVRSNSQGELGFVTDMRRINVAVTRARRQVCVICDGDTLRYDTKLASLLDFLETHGEYKSATEFGQEFALSGSHKAGSAAKMLRNETRGTKKALPSGKPAKDSKPGQKGGIGGNRNVSEASKKEKEQLELVWTEETRKKLMSFRASPSPPFFKFDACLNSYQRLKVHEIAEELGLLHESLGEGDQRYIQVSKKDNGSKEASGSSTEVGSSNQQVRERIQPQSETPNEDNESTAVERTTSDAPKQSSQVPETRKTEISKQTTGAKPADKPKQAQQSSGAGSSRPGEGRTVGRASGSTESAYSYLANMRANGSLPARPTQSIVESGSAKPTTLVMNEPKQKQKQKQKVTKPIQPVTEDDEEEFDKLLSDFAAMDRKDQQGSSKKQPAFSRLVQESIDMQKQEIRNVKAGQQQAKRAALSKALDEKISKEADSRVKKAKPKK